MTPHEIPIPLTEFHRYLTDEGAGLVLGRIFNGRAVAALWHASGVEVADRGYRRQEFELTEPGFDGATWMVANASAVTFESSPARS